jgi:hypothetical protein
MYLILFTVLMSKQFYSHRGVCISCNALVSTCVSGIIKMRIVKRIEVIDPYDQWGCCQIFGYDKAK